MTDLNHNSPEFARAVRKVLLTAEAPLNLGWDLLRRERTRQHVHLTDKELFLAGAGFLFDAIVYMLDPVKGQEPTAQDLAMISKIHDELMRFHEHFNSKFK